MREKKILAGKKKSEGERGGGKEEEGEKRRKVERGGEGGRGTGGECVHRCVLGATPLLRWSFCVYSMCVCGREGGGELKLLKVSITCD